MRPGAHRRAGCVAPASGGPARQRAGRKPGTVGSEGFARSCRATGASAASAAGRLGATRSPRCPWAAGGVKGSRGGRVRNAAHTTQAHSWSVATETTAPPASLAGAAAEAASTTASGTMISVARQTEVREQSEARSGARTVTLVQRFTRTSALAWKLCAAAFSLTMSRATCRSVLQAQWRWLSITEPSSSTQGTITRLTSRRRPA